MTSVNYNYSASTALRALQASSQSLEQAQIRVATGKKINGSSDNATLWALSKKIESDVSSSQTYIEGIKTTSAKVKVASAAVDSVSSILTQMRAKIVAAQLTDSTGKAALQIDFTALQEQLKTVVKQATFEGTENYLNQTTTSIAVRVSDNASETITLGLTTSLISDSGVTGLLNKVRTTSTTAVPATATKSIVTIDFTTDDLDEALTDINSAISDVNAVASSFGSTLKRLNTASSFLTTLNDIKTSAISSLVDADLNEESAKISALQTKQSLQTTVLQIANQSTQNILRLFQ